MLLDLASWIRNKAEAEHGHENSWSEKIIIILCNKFYNVFKKEEEKEVVCTGEKAFPNKFSSLSLLLLLQNNIRKKDFCRLLQNLWEKHLVWKVADKMKCNENSFKHTLALCNNFCTFLPFSSLVKILFLS